MSRDIKVISGTLTRDRVSQLKRTNRYYTLCKDGSDNERQINDSLHESKGNRIWALSPDAWERIFGGK